VKELSDSQVLGSGSSTATLSSGTLSTLNSAFTKLIGDLGGGTSSASSSSASSSSQSTAALQSFLTNFLGDLENNSAGSSSTLGTSVDTTA
jgi:hypothetical protein